MELPGSIRGDPATSIATASPSVARALVVSVTGTSGSTGEGMVGKVCKPRDRYAALGVGSRQRGCVIWISADRPDRGLFVPISDGSEC